MNESLVDDAVAYYQVASEMFKDGKLKRRPEDSTKVEPLPLPLPLPVHGGWQPQDSFAVMASPFR